MRPDRPAVGIRRTSVGTWQAYIRVAGEFRSKHFPADTAIEAMKAWRNRQRARHELGMEPETEAGTFADDCRTYLAAVQSMRSFADRKYRIEQWCQAFPAVLRRNLLHVARSGSFCSNGDCC